MRLCMRTTLDINDELLTAARRRASEQGSSLTAFVEHALAAALAPEPSRAKPFKLHWKTHRGELLPGVDISDRDALFDSMGGRR